MCLQVNYYNDICTKTEFINKKKFYINEIAMNLILAIAALCCVMIVFTGGTWADAAITAGICSLILRDKNS